jgi:small subunit ribosomal protein S8
MLVSDPVADMLARIRNAMLARHEHLSIPGSGIKRRIAEILEAEGFVSTAVWVEPTKDNPQGRIDIKLKWDGREPVIDGLKRISKPGCRVYAGRDDMPEIRNGLGLAIVSTSRGVMTNKDARRAGVGGEVLCAIW